MGAVVVAVILFLEATFMYVVSIVPAGGWRRLNRGRHAHKPSHPDEIWESLTTFRRGWFYAVPVFYLAALVFLVIGAIGVLAT
jgi:hypothetical protein